MKKMTNSKEHREKLMKAFNEKEYVPGLRIPALSYRPNTGISLEDRVTALEKKVKLLQDEMDEN